MVIESINPATLEKIGEVQKTPIEDLDAIFTKARKTQQDWRQIETKKRARIVVKVNEYITENMDEISELISKETGKPPLEAFASEVYGVVDATFYYYNTADQVIDKKEEIELGFYSSLDKSSYVIYKPAGIVSVIGPYNYPFAIPFSQIVQSLIAGNAVVFKPSSDTVLVGKKIQEVFDSIENFPEGLMQTVYGSGSTLGKPLIDKANRVIFTGSTETGKTIMRIAADTLTPVCLELGGKSEMIVLPDANLERAARAARWGCFTNSGQVCSSVKRLYVHQSIKDDFTKKLIELTKQLKQGNPLDFGIDLGAMINEIQMNKVLKAIENAKSEGAKVLIGGERNKELNGYFIKPTILGNCTNQMDCVQKEIFGPVLPIIPFKNENEVIELANANPFGLTSSIWTENYDKAIEMGKNLDTGTVMINEVVYTFALAQTPWGGPKSSGIGRTHGKFGFLEVLEPLHVHIDKYKEPDLWWMPYDEDFMEVMENFKIIAKSLVVRD
ncbi:MAG: aldehyde dehydrogenase [Candidatus Lokiarchaeota archaeon]|nr:aldehyde dehydrogenase [Candidatus Lokiarchaeota archaeon]